MFIPTIPSGDAVSPPIYDSLTNITMEVVARPTDSVSTLPDARWFTKAQSSASADHDFMIGYLGQSASTVQLRTRLRLGAGTVTRIGATVYTLPMDLHFVVTYDGEDQIWYVNGLEVESFAEGGALLNPRTGTLFPFLMHDANQQGGGIEKPIGFVQKYAIWNRALSAGEVRELFANPFGLLRKERRRVVSAPAPTPADIGYLATKRNRHNIGALVRR